MNGIHLRDYEVYGILHNNVRRVRRPINLREFQTSTTPGYTYTFRGNHGLWNDFSEFDLVTSDYCPYVYGAAYTVKEAWATSQCVDVTKPKWPYQGYPLWYKADNAVRYTGATEGGPAFMTPGKWYSGYGMPAHVARFALRVTGVHVQPLEAATEEDAQAEGHSTTRPWINPKHKEPDDREDPRVVGYSSGSFAKQNMRAVYDAYYGAVAKPWCWLLDVEPVMLYQGPRADDRQLNLAAFDRQDGSSYHLPLRGYVIRYKDGAFESNGGSADGTGYPTTWLGDATVFASEAAAFAATRTLDDVASVMCLRQVDRLPEPNAAFRAGVKWAKASARIVQSGDVPEPLGEIRGMPPSTWYDIDWSLTDTALK